MVNFSKIGHLETTRIFFATGTELLDYHSHRCINHSPFRYQATCAFVQSSIIQLPLSLFEDASMSSVLLLFSLCSLKRKAFFVIFHSSFKIGDERCR